MSATGPEAPFPHTNAYLLWSVGDCNPSLPKLEIPEVDLGFVKVVVESSCLVELRFVHPHITGFLLLGQGRMRMRRSTWLRVESSFWKGCSW